jgi:gamma-glutamyltranspeptidase
MSNMHVLWQPGEIFSNPAMAKVLREIGAKGKDAFYKGEIAERIVRVLSCPCLACAALAALQ